MLGFTHGNLYTFDAKHIFGRRVRPKHGIIGIGTPYKVVVVHWTASATA